MEFRALLKKLREDKKFSIRQLATYSNVSAGYLSQIESGERGLPSPEILKKIHKPLGVEYEYLLQEAGYLDKTDKGNFFFFDKDAISEEDAELLENTYEVMKERARKRAEEKKNK